MPDTTLSPRLPVRVPLETKKLGILQSLQAAQANIIGIIPEAATQLPIISGRTAKRWHMLMEPRAIREVLMEKLDQYPKSEVTKNLLKPAIGESLFIAEGAHWRWQRRTVAPVFSHRNVQALSPIMTRAADRSAERIAAAGKRAVNMLDEMVGATFDVIADVTFSGDASFDRRNIHHAIDEYISAAGKISILDVLGAPDWVPRPSRLRSGQAMREAKAQADRAIEARATEDATGTPDLLDLLLAGEDPKSGRKMTTAELRDNLMTFIVAGHATTALSLAWSFYLLAFDPAVQDRVREEANAVLKGRSASRTDVERLPFIRNIIDEALRLYPPGGMISRTAMTRDQLCGHEILPDDTVMIPIYALHRHAALWEKPDAFLPDRWDDREGIDRYAYLPFGDGPRICIGASFARQEAIIILATLISRFRFSAIKGRQPKPVMILTLRPEGGVWLQAEPA